MNSAEGIVREAPSAIDPPLQVTFATDLNSVREISSHREYTSAEKLAIWSGKEELAALVQRNTVEYRAEGWKMEGVLEEDALFVLPDGELVHPAIKSMEGLFQPVNEEKYFTGPPKTVFDGLVDKCGYAPANMIYRHLVDDIKQNAELAVPYRNIVVNVKWTNFEQTNEARASIICPYSRKQYTNLNYNSSREVDECIDIIQKKNLKRERERSASQQIHTLVHAFHRFEGDKCHRDWKHSFKRDIASMEGNRKKRRLV